MKFCHLKLYLSVLILVMTQTDFRSYLNFQKTERKSRIPFLMQLCPWKIWTPSLDPPGSMQNALGLTTIPFSSLYGSITWTLNFSFIWAMNIRVVCKILYMILLCEHYIVVLLRHCMGLLFGHRIEWALYNLALYSYAFESPSAFPYSSVFQWYVSGIYIIQKPCTIFI